MFCKHCKSKMVYTLSFKKGRAYEFYRCRKCYSTSKEYPYFYDLKIRQNK